MMKIFTIKKLLVLFVFGLTASFMLNGQNIVSNGGFENWTGGLPDDWTTIGPGIDVTEETTIINGGSSSASIDVLTGTQGDTDFRQSVSVVAGTDYTVSVWVYHTEGFMKARLYVDTYLGYSDNTITGAWQELTYEFTAAASEDIEIGLRFYDQTGFDGAEIVYVDDYVIEVDAGTGGGPSEIYNEPFDADLGATMGYSVIGAEVWEWADFGLPAGCSKMSGYAGGAQDNEDWLITNAINCDSYENIMLSFDHARNYADNSGLSVWISNDYDGSSDPNSSGTWTDLTSSFTFPTGGWDFIDAGSVDISTYVGSTTYVGFKYTSNTSDAATWELDNITVEGDLNFSVFVAGSFTDWVADSSDFEMSMNANGLFELTYGLLAGTNEYKIVDDGNWYPNNNQIIDLAGYADTIWKYNYEANLVTHTLPVVAGNFLSTMGGNDWDPTELMGEMTDPDGDDIYTLELTIPTAGNYECKVTLNNNWDQSTSGNTPFVSDGVNPTTFTYDFPNNITTVSGPPLPTAIVTFAVVDTLGKYYEGFFLKGSWDENGFYDPNWGNGMEHSMFYDDGTNGDTVAGDHIWMCEQELTADGGTNPWQWGINDSESNWVAGNWEFTVVDDTPFYLSWDVPNEPFLIINEIMYNSPGADQEWVEIHNISGAEIDLENWKLIDSDGSHTPIIIPAGYSIPDAGYFTIAVEGADPFPFTPDYDGRGNFQLNNGGDVVRLYNASGILINKVSYTDADPWPTEPDGDGPTLSLIDPNTDNTLPQSWLASLEEGGTPGAENFPPIPFVDVTYPDGGEFFELGMDYTITWAYGFWDGDIEIELLKEDADPEPIVQNIPLSDGSYTWTVWTELEVDDDYKIRISGLGTDDPVGESEDFFSIIEPYVIPEIVITEIMYNPPEAGDDTLEFLEFYNNSLDTIDLEGFFMSQGIDYTFPSLEMLPDTFMLLSKDSLAMLNTFGVNAYQWTAGGLSNGGEPVELSDSFGNVVDYVPFEDQMPWDTLADGQGPSLTLCNPDSDNEMAENWTASVNMAAINAEGDTIYATPGFECQLALFAGFEGTPTYLPVGDSVMFVDQTVGSPTSWLWTFEGGTPETYNGQVPPYIIYNDAGAWDVTLVVSDGINQDSVTIEEYVHTGMAPVADFEADEVVIVAGNSTNFTSLSTGEELTFAWYFEGGTPETSDEENPSDIAYLIPDWATYDVTLVVTNPYGSDSITKEDYIEVNPVSVDEIGLNDRNVNLFPNPNNGTFTISIPGTAHAELNVLDIHGKSIMKNDFSGTQHIQLPGLEKGVYLIKILDIDSGAIVVKRLLIK